MTGQIIQLSILGMRKPSTPASYRNEFIERVKAARVLSGLSPKQVADRLHVKKDTYERWEGRALIPHHLIIPFCAVVKLDPYVLLTGSPLDYGQALAATHPRRVA